MNRLTLGQLQDDTQYRIATAVGESPASTRFVTWLNNAQERLLSKGLWWGTCAKYRMAAYDGCLTLPPELATIETVAVNHEPVPPHDLWFEFLENGFGTRSLQYVGTGGGSALGGVRGVTGIPEANYRGQFPVFRDFTHNGNPKKIVLVCDLAADVGATVTVCGYDQNGNWIRTQVGGLWQDGETLALAQSPGTTSTNYFSRISAVKFAVRRSGQCWLYELDTLTNIQTLTGRYEWWELNPSHGRWYFPGIPAVPTACTPPAGWQQSWSKSDLAAPPVDCHPALVEIIGKLDFIPALLPADHLIIQSPSALKFMVMAEKKEEFSTSTAALQEALALEVKAIAELDDQLDHYLGSGRRIGITVAGVSGDGMPVETFL